MKITSDKGTESKLIIEGQKFFIYAITEMVQGRALCKNTEQCKSFAVTEYKTKRKETDAGTNAEGHTNNIPGEKQS